MMFQTLSLFSLVAAVLAAPVAEPDAVAEPGSVLQARAPSCNVASDACYISCRGGSSYLHCYDSYCKATGTAGPYGYCVCKCTYA
ncbi:hypothetical protein VTI28DRAFT_9710 [Corynascus sepedonium]